MLDLAFIGDCIELFSHLRDRSYRLGAELLAHIVGQHRRRGKQPQAIAAEGIEQCIVVELADHVRPHVEHLEPLIDAAADGVVPGRQQHRRVAQAVRKFCAVFLRQRRHAEQRQLALAQQVAEDLQVGARRDRTVGQHHIELVNRQRAKQRLEAVFVADQLDRLRQLQRGIQQARGDQFRQRIRNADCQPHGRYRIGGGQRILHLLGQREDLFRVAERNAPRIGQHQPPALRRQQRASDRLVQQRQLRADGLHGHALTLGRAGDAAFLGHDPEVVQVTQVQTG